MAKGKIIKVGTIVNDNPKDWVFDMGGQGVGISIGTDQILYGGYTVKELKEIEAKHKESIND